MTYKTRRTYVVLAIADLKASLLVGCVEKTIANCRKSNDGTKAIVKYSGNEPASVKTLRQTKPATQVFTHEQILAELEKALWKHPSAA